MQNVPEVQPPAAPCPPLPVISPCRPAPPPPRFTAWLGNFSSSNKQRRLLGELHTRMTSSGSLECDRTALRLGYLPLLRNSLVQPLVGKGKEGIEEVLHQMADYSLAREDIDFITGVCPLHGTLWRGRCAGAGTGMRPTGLPGALISRATRCHPIDPLLPPMPCPDVTKWKTKGAWGEDPMKPVETQVGGVERPTA